MAKENIMSDKDNSVIDDKTKDSIPPIETVARKAYEEVSIDMHKYKAKNKQLDLELSEYKAKVKSIEESKLKEQSQWQELYEREKTRSTELEGNLNKEKDLFMRSVKLSALKSELGDVKDVYLRHANVDEIVVNDDGTLGSESVKSVANIFRQEYPEVLPNKSNLNITSNIPGNFNQSIDKPLSDMTYEQKLDMLKKLKGE